MTEKDDEKRLDSGLAWAPAIQHPLDASLLRKIDKLPLLPKIMGWVIDRQREQRETTLSGDGFHVTEKSCPEVYAAFVTACEALGLDADQFGLFCEANSALNAYVTGSAKPTVILTRALADVCSKEELAFVLGHELGHYICGHVRCHSLARYLKKGIGWRIPPVQMIKPLLMAWSRYSELSADRAGLLACKDFDAASRVYVKLAGCPLTKAALANPQQLLKDQAIQYAAQLGEKNLARRLWHQTKHVFGATHPRAIERFEALEEWHDTGFYDDLVEASPEERCRIAQSVGTDWLKNALDMVVVEAAADYAEKDLGHPRKETLRLLRKAFLHGGTLNGTMLEEIVYAELVIDENKDGKFDYTLVLFRLQGRNDPVKATIPVGYTDDPDFAPGDVRKQFIRTRQKQIKILFYKP